MPEQCTILRMPDLRGRTGQLEAELAVLCCAVLCCAELAVLCCAVLCCAVL